MRRVYYGWVMVGLAAAAMVGTLPGRTQGLGLVTEPLLADLKIDRVDYAQLNLWATLIGSLFAIGIGRFIDRLGSRIVLTTIALALGIVVCAMSQVSSFWSLAIAITLSRGFGQSALSVVSIAMVGQWFSKRIDMAMAVFSIALSIGFMIVFPVVGALVQSSGWRSAWLAIGLALILGLAPISWLFARKNTETIVTEVAEGPSMEWRDALATPAFWLFSLGAALYGLVASGIGLFNESILAERGFGANVYYQTLVVTALTALIGNFAGGWLAARVSLTLLMAIALGTLAAGVGVLPFFTSIVHVMAWAVAMGLGGGMMAVLFFTAYPRVYGRRHLGRIQGIAQAITVLASAVGPLLLAWCVRQTGSYTGMFEILAAVIALVALIALAVPTPGPSLDRLVKQV